jgi:hypothetical protein
MSNASSESASVVRTHAPPKPRKLHDVPFVEMYGTRLHGVVSSKKGPDERIYVSFFEAGSMDFSCSTNNNRPCGGLRGSPCKHLEELLSEGAVQYGVERVARFLQIPGDLPSGTAPRDLIRHIRGRQTKGEAGIGFSRFLNYLRYIELKGSSQPLPEMSWFTSG